MFLAMSWIDTMFSGVGGLFGVGRDKPGASDIVTPKSGSSRLRHVCLEYSYAQLQQATDGFHKSRQLGEGSYGTVFRATMPDGSDTVVKVIDLSALEDESSGFEEEVTILSKFRHPNLVVLMGWGRKNRRRFLIYEFLQGGDVEDRLQKCKAGQVPFNWDQRLAVAVDAATGLAHLHNMRPHAFHRDVKSANILLGPGGAKLADFGFACASKKRHAKYIQCEDICGSAGYICPTYSETGDMTEGSEVYSFGMLLLEMLLNEDPCDEDGEEDVFPIQEIVKPGRSGAVERCVKAADPTASWPPLLAKEIAVLALACIQEEDAHRPSFNRVCQALRALQARFPLLPMQSVHSSPGPNQHTCVSFVSDISQAGVPYNQPLQDATGQTVSFGSFQLLPSAQSWSHPVNPADQLQVGQWVHAPMEGPYSSVVSRSDPRFPPVEVTLRLVQRRGAPLEELGSEFIFFHLYPVIDHDGRRIAPIGRSHQPVWFEKVVLVEDLNCVSRTACEFSWGGSNPKNDVLTLRVIGHGLVLLNDKLVKRGRAVKVKCGSHVTFAREANADGSDDFLSIFTFIVHFMSRKAVVGGANGVFKSQSSR